jgi:hypothetical protein
VFVRASKKQLTVAKALAYCTMELITAVKNFIIQAPGLNYTFNSKPLPLAFPLTLPSYQFCLQSDASNCGVTYDRHLRAKYVYSTDQ